MANKEQTNNSMMSINLTKTNFMIFTRSTTKFTTRFMVNGFKIDRVKEQKVCGLWLTDDIKWEKNTRELTKGAFARISMLTKLKYVGVALDELVEVYKLFVRSLLEYCSVVWHSSLTIENIQRIERVQKASLRIILGEMYVDYGAALEMCNLTTLYERREDRCLNFAKKCLGHPLNRRFFPLNPNCHDLHEKSKEKYTVNFAKSGALKKSAIPYLQRRLNQEHV